MGILLAVFVLAFSLIIPVSYRVDSSMILKTDDIIYISAPFDGFITAANYKAGEDVDKNSTLLTLDDKDLILEEAGLLAEKTKIMREEAKARAEMDLAQMRIAQSQLQQVQSRLDIVQLRLAKTSLSSPIDGIVIEGDQHERIGSPVRQGEVLFKIGRVEDIKVEVKVEVKVEESQIHNIEVNSLGEIALSSRPNDVFAVKVDRIEPSAVTGASGNVFQVICSFQNPVPSWFRPGMTGIAKINSGKKTLFWILGHKTFDFLRLKFWW